MHRRRAGDRRGDLRRLPHRPVLRPRLPRPPRPACPSGSQVESTDPPLRDSLARIALLPSAAAHRDAAAAYLRLGIRDKAYDHLERAITLIRRMPRPTTGSRGCGAHWGFPEYGMADAQHAVKVRAGLARGLQHARDADTKRWACSTRPGRHAGEPSSSTAMRNTRSPT